MVMDKLHHMNNIKLARQSYDLRAEIEKCLGAPNKNGFWKCPFHNDETPSFHVFQDGYKCFGCGEHGDYFDWLAFWQKRPLKDVLRDHRINPEEELRRKAEYAQVESKRLEENIARAQQVLKELREAQSWIKYHENLDMDGGKPRMMWEARGVPFWYQEMVCLGYDPAHKFRAGDEGFTTPTLNFPVYEPLTRLVLNVRHRLLGEEVDKWGKYRPERSGLPAYPFVASPDKPIDGKVIVVEGEIKSMVVYSTLGNEQIQVLGLPGQGNFSSPKNDVVEKLIECDVYIIPDPKVDYKPLVKKLKRVHVVELQEKVDDIIVDYYQEGGRDWLRGILNGARKL